MNLFTKLSSAGAVALALVAAAGPTHADDFANFAKVGTGTNIRWIQSGGAHTGGHLISGGSSATVATNQNTLFLFNIAPLDGLGPLSALFKLDGTALSGNGATGVIGSTDESQQQIDGYFSFTYNGPAAAVAGSGCTGPCTNLLTAHFTNGWINGGQASAHFTDSATNPGSTLYFTSDFIDFTDATDPNFDFTLLVPTGAPRIDYTVGAGPGFVHRSLNTFKAASNGNFGITLAVPEPATWALMIMGFGGVGSVLRRRRSLAATVA